MDILKAPPPRPPSPSFLSTTVTGGSDILKPLTNRAKDVYDYIFIDSGSPDSYLNADVTNFINDSIVYNSTFNNSIESINITRTTTDEDVGDLIIMAVLSIILGLMILITIIGNVFVIAAIILERNLQNVANYLVASLAVADLFVACLVMPLGAVYEISRGWILGPELCDIWTSCDVLCCTASILHLVAIATDRYWAVTNVDYIHSRTSRRVFIMIFLVWFAAVIVSLAPQFGWKDPEYLQRIEQQKCMVSQDISYQVFATCCTFYVPLLVILVLYWKIYQTARKRIHRRRPKPVLNANNNQTVPAKSKSRLKFRLASKFTNQAHKSAVSSLGLVEGNSTNTVNTVEDTEDSSDTKKGNGSGGGNTAIEVTTFSNDEGPTSSKKISTVSQQVATIVGTNNCENNDHQNNSKPQLNLKAQQQQQQNLSTITPSKQLNATTPTGSINTIVQTQNQISSSQVSTPLPQHHSQQQQQGQISSISNPHSQVTKRKETLEAKRERKAAKTLAIITGAFVICWLPFFLMALLLPLCESCEINDWIASLFLWLGYFNSTLNPVIYTIFSPEFRQAFKRILFGAHRSSNYYRGSRF